jgi:hypothetical protein
MIMCKLHRNAVSPPSTDSVQCLHDLAGLFFRNFSRGLLVTDRDQYFQFVMMTGDGSPFIVGV